MMPPSEPSQEKKRQEKELDVQHWWRPAIYLDVKGAMNEGSAIDVRIKDSPDDRVEIVPNGQQDLP
jgi:hypothetical protein